MKPSGATAPAIGVPASSRLDTIRRPAPVRSELKGEVSAQQQPGWLTDEVVRTVHPNGFAQSIAFELKTRASAVYEVAHGLAPRALKAWWIPTIVKVTGDFRILDALEAQVGRVAYQIPVARSADDVDIVTKAAIAMRECGEVFNAIGTSIADGTITAEEFQVAEKEFAEAHAALAAAEHLMRTKVKR